MEGFKENLPKVNAPVTSTAYLAIQNLIEPIGTLHVSASQHNSYRPEQFHTSAFYTGCAHPNQLVYPVNPTPPSYSLSPSNATSAPHYDHFSSRRSLRRPSIRWYFVVIFQLKITSFLYFIPILALIIHESMYIFIKYLSQTTTHIFQLKLPINGVNLTLILRDDHILNPLL